MPVENWFPTPIYYHDFPEEDWQRINKQIKDRYLDGINLSEIDMWKPDGSGQVFTTYDYNKGTNIIAEKKFRALNFHIFDQVGKYLEEVNWKAEKIHIGNSWINIGTKGSIIQGHHYHGYGVGFDQISGVYYVDGQADNSHGRIRFLAPHHIKHPKTFPFGDRIPAEVHYDAKPGRLLLFPSWLMHYVTPITVSEYHRISVSFNLTLS